MGGGPTDHQKTRDIRTFHFSHIYIYKIHQKKILSSDQVLLYIGFPSMHPRISKISRQKKSEKSLGYSAKGVEKGAERNREGVIRNNAPSRQGNRLLRRTCPKWSGFATAFKMGLCLPSNESITCFHGISLLKRVENQISREVLVNIFICLFIYLFIFTFSSQKITCWGICACPCLALRRAYQQFFLHLSPSWFRSGGRWGGGRS